MNKNRKPIKIDEEEDIKINKEEENIIKIDKQ